MSNKWIKEIKSTSDVYLKDALSETEYKHLFTNANKILKGSKNRSDFIKAFTQIYIKIIKKQHQSEYKGANTRLHSFLTKNQKDLKIIWGDSLKKLSQMKNESVQLMVTSPPYYNAREYSQYNNLKVYLDQMREIIRESYRVLDNHRVFVFNVGDIFDNDKLTELSPWSAGFKKTHGTNSVWGKRRIPLGSHFTQIFEEEGFTFVDDFIWDKGEVQSERHKNGNKPFPFYQYPMNCYEHILIFHKHRRDDTRFPCPLCGTLKVNGNAFSEIGLRSWECKNLKCPERSAANRGKRFSLKTIYTQGIRNDEDKIDKEFIKKWRKDVVQFGPVIKINSKGENKLGHTAPFPELLPEFSVRMFSYTGDVVLDPFAGSFTTAIIANKLKRVGVGIELNKKMFKQSIIKNIKKHLGDKQKISEF